MLILTVILGNFVSFLTLIGSFLYKSFDMLGLFSFP
jgi:hypothetical protein